MVRYINELASFGEPDRGFGFDFMLELMRVRERREKSEKRKKIEVNRDGLCP